MESCLLCLLEINNESENSIKVNSTQWQELEIHNIIEQHLWHVETLQPSTCICTICWEALYDFHKYYTHIKQVQNNKIGENIKIQFESENIAIREVLSQDLIREKPNNPIIEHEEEYLSEDDKPLIQINKNTRQFNTVNIAEDPLNLPKSSKKANKSLNIKHKIKYSGKNGNGHKAIETDEQFEENRSLEIVNEDKYHNDDSDTDSNCKSDRSSTNKSSATKNSKAMSMEADKIIAENFKITCYICEIPFETFDALCKHFKKEHKEPPYVTCCDTKFFKRRFLLEHIRRHLDPNYLKCNQCGKQLKDRICLKLHLKIHGPREMNHCCDVCGVRFHNRTRLETHKTTHFTEEEKLFPCSECSKNFGNKQTLSSHIVKVHAPVNCDICGMILANKSVLNRHKILKHPVGEIREYICVICSKISKNEIAHKTHVKNVHQKGYDHKCTFCEKAFKRSRGLKDHMATHTNTYLYNCSWCPKMFKNRDGMQNHRRKFHLQEWKEQIRKRYFGNVNPNNEPTSINIGNDHINDP